MSGAAPWLILGLIVAAAEMLTPGFFLIWVGFAMLGTGLVTLATALDGPWQLALFSVLSAVIALWAARTVRRRPRGGDINAPGAGLIGRLAEAEQFRGGEGRVRLGDGAWQARTLDGADPQPGQRVRVVGLEGTTLLVGVQAAAPRSPAAPGAPAHGLGAPPS